jgi:hypothetical protein
MDDSVDDSLERLMNDDEAVTIDCNDNDNGNGDGGGDEEVKVSDDIDASDDDDCLFSKNRLSWWRKR